MFGKTASTRALVYGLSGLSGLSGAAACFIALSLASPVQAGGFGLSVELPSPSSAAAAQGKDTLLVIHAMGCRGPGAALSAKAEGLVEGKRVSLPLRLEQRGNDVYTLTRQWPTEGTWLVSLSAKSRPIVTPRQTFRAVTNALVEFAPGGTVRNVTDITDKGTGETRQFIRTRHLMGKDKDKEITAVLQRLQAASTQNNPQKAVAAIPLRAGR